MPSDSDLRRRFQEGTQPRGDIDVDAVLRRARARRRPRAVLAGAGSLLAIAAIAVPASLASLGGSAGGASDTSTVAGDAAAPESAGGGSAGETYLTPASADRLNLCTAPVAGYSPSPSGLVISVTPVTAPADAPAVPVTVTLTNDGTQQIFGTTSSRPSLTLSHDGITIWHTNGPSDMSARIVDLGPGESMTYETSFEPVVCGVEDDAAESFREDLPPAGPGTYLLSAAIDVVHDDGATTEQIGGPAVAVTLN